MPAFYERDEQDVPRRWVGMTKDAIRTVAPRFCTRRMVREYVERMYEPAMQVPDAGKPDWLAKLAIKEMKIDWDVMSQKQAEWMDYWSQNIKGKGGK